MSMNSLVFLAVAVGMVVLTTTAFSGDLPALAYSLFTVGGVVYLE